MSFLRHVNGTRLAFCLGPFFTPRTKIVGPWEPPRSWWKHTAWGMEESKTKGIKKQYKRQQVGNRKKIGNVHYLNRFIRNFVFDFLMFLGVFEAPNAISNHVLWKKSDPNLENDKSKCFWNFALMRFLRKVTKTESITSNIGKGA